jgi:DNA-binding transcriptional MerR regulator
MHRAAPPTRSYSIDALLAEGFSLSSLRYYVRTGVLPRAEGGRGRAAYYTDRHLRILREIKRTKDERRDLRDLRDWAHDTFPHAFPQERS